jgi:putative heme-binding domain-containing protein
MLASRREWATLFLAEVDRSQIKPREVAPDVVRQLSLYKDPDMDRLLQKHWSGINTRLTSQEKIAEGQRIKGLLATPGDATTGKDLYAQRCAACHMLFNEGGRIGPDLTGYDRRNPDFWLVGILDPSVEIREGFGAYTAKLKDGQTLMGMLVQQDANSVVLQDMAGQKHTARAADVEQLDAFSQSLMPEGLLSGLSDAELRDLFAYLMKP